MDNLIIFPTDYDPLPNERRRLWDWQRAIDGWRASLELDWQRLRYTRFQQVVSKEKFHNGIRDNWKIFKGFRDTRLLEFMKVQ